MRRIFICIIAMVAVITAFASAEEEDSVLDFYIYPTEFLEVAVEFDYKGITIAEGVETSINLILDSGWMFHRYYRDEDGSPLVPPVDQSVTDRTVFPMVPINWTLELEQGLLWNDSTERNLLTVFAGYEGRSEILLPDPNAAAIPLFFTSGLPETAGLTETAFKIGMIYDDLESGSHQVFKGIYATVGTNFAPGFINGLSDYYRLYLDSRFFIPIFDLEPETEMNLLNMYLVSRFKISWLDGSYLPNHARLDNRTEIRGIQNERYNTRLTVTNNTELRMQFPAFLSPGLLPMVFLYFDSAYYMENQAYNGFIASAGGGAGLNIFNVLLIGMRSDYNLLQAALDGTVFKPFELNIFFQFY